jgi:hypothetical protein
VGQPSFGGVCFPRHRAWLFVNAILALLAIAAPAHAQNPPGAGVPQLIVGPNRNMSGGDQVLELNPFFVRGDVLGRAQNEPSCAISTRNPLHVLCGANDYRMIDVPGITTTQIIRDAWQGVFQSTDGGDTWNSTLHPGFFLDPQPNILKALDLRAAADPTVRSGPAGMTFYSGIAFKTDRSRNVVFVSTFADANNRENDDMPFKHVRTVIVDLKTTPQFIDKPWMMVEAAPPGRTCRMLVPTGSETPPPWTKTRWGRIIANWLTRVWPGWTPRPFVMQEVPASIIHIAYSVFQDETDTNSHIMYARSDNCGLTFSRPIRLNTVIEPSNGVAIVKALDGSRRLFAAWRRVKPANMPAAAPNALITTVSNDNGATWSRPRVRLICPFDQGTTITSFRTTAFPTMTVDRVGRAYVAWSDRGTKGAECDPFGAARIVVSSSTDGVNWSPAAPVAATPLERREHQIFPSIAFTAGKLFLAWLDFRNDASQVFGQFVNEAEVFGNQRAIRHTADMMVAMADPGRTPAFEYVQLSNYLTGTTTSGQHLQLQWNAVNRRWARKGTVPFDGDFLDIATMPYLPPDPGAKPPRLNWTPNDGRVPVVPNIVIAWTDNRDMSEPEGEDKNFVPGDSTKPEGDPARVDKFLADVPYATPGDVSLPAKSIWDPTLNRIACVSPLDVYKTSTTNQNSYSARANVGFVAASPGNNKNLGSVARAFVIFVRNDASLPKTFRLQANQPPAAIASFDQFNPAVTVITVFVPAHSSVTRTVYISQRSPTVPLAPDTSASVDVSEISGAAVVATTTVPLNADPSAPEVDSNDIAVREVYAPEVDSPEVDSPEVDSRVINASQTGAPEVDSPEVDSLAMRSSEVGAPEVDSPEVDSQDILSAPVGGDYQLTDAKFEVTNRGNTTAQFNAKAFILEPSPGTEYQVIVRQKLELPAVNSQCQSTVVSLSKVLVNVGHVSPVAPEVDSTGAGAPEVDSPEVDSSAPNTATFYLAPFDTAEVIVRARSAPGQIPDMRRVGIAARAEAVSTDEAAAGVTQPPVITSFLSIGTNALPTASVKLPYAFQLVSSGGEQPHTWTLFSDPELPGGGSLPPGLSLSLEGVVSGTPTAVGTFTFTAQVTDDTDPPLGPQIVRKTLTVVVVQPGTASLAFVTQPSDTALNQIIAPAVSVRLVNASGTGIYNAPVTIALGTHPAGATLSGTTVRTTNRAGVAVFDDLRVNALGSYTLVAINGSLNATSRAFDATLPDLVVSLLSHTPASPVAGEPITFNAIVQNLGTGIAPASTLMFKVGNETAGDEATLRAVPSLAPGAMFEVAREASLAAGGYTNSAVADFGNAIAESNETNNTATDAFTVSAAGFANVSFVTQPSDAVMDVPISPAIQVLVRDNTGAVVPGVQVELSFPGNFGTGLQGDLTAVTDATGIATFANVHIPEAGLYQIRATVPAFPLLPPALSTSFEILAPPAPIGYAGLHAFAAATGASNSTVPLPNLGEVTSAVDGLLTFTAIGGGTFSIGAAGNPDVPSGDWYGPLPGNDIAMGTEALQVDFANPVRAMGFFFVEPNSTMPQPYGGTPVDSLYEVTLFNQASNPVGSFTFNAPDDQVVFISVSSAVPFTRAQIIDTTGNGDDEYFGEFYSDVYGPIPTFVVTNTSDSAAGSLRRAIEAANETSRAQIIFNLPPGESTIRTIAPASPLPPLTAPIRIDGTTQPGFSGEPLIEVTGINAGAGASGFRIESSDSMIRGLVINGFEGAVRMDGSGTANRILGNYIGTNGAGDEAVGNSWGIYIQSGAHFIGGPTLLHRNVISGNLFGVVIEGSSGSSDNLIEGNYIGPDSGGIADLGNVLGGVVLSNSDANTLRRNVISGNGTDPAPAGGVEIHGDSNRLEGNLVGTTADGMAALGNQGSGILVFGDQNIVGGTAASQRNVISGNSQFGVVIDSGDGNLVQGNYVGTNVAGDGPLANRGSIAVGVNSGATNTTIGGDEPGAGNVVSGNTTSFTNGISIQNGAIGTRVEGNLIGTDALGGAPLGNSGNGIDMYGTATIGGVSVGARNVISSNSGAGVFLHPGVTGATIQGNYIGTGITGANFLGNGVAGIAVVGADNTMIGGTTAEARNVISGNSGPGVTVERLGSDIAEGTVIQGNYIGLDATGTQALGNAGAGVRTTDAGLMVGLNNTARNIISANSIGIEFSNSGTEFTSIVQGNFIGTDVTGSLDRGNDVGVLIDGAPGTVIGVPGERANVISGNGIGISISGISQPVIDGFHNTAIYGNIIGLQVPPLSGPLGNGIGVLIGNADNLIGSTEFPNVIADNTEDGIRIVGSASGSTGNVIVANTIAGNGGDGIAIPAAVVPSAGNSISSNLISGNSGLGIDLGSDGVTPNDTGDPDAGPNDLQNFPVITAATSNSVSGTLNSLPNTQYAIQLFANTTCDPSGSGEGQTPLAFLFVTTNASGNATFSHGIGLPPGQYLTATAERFPLEELFDGIEGGTSEFSTCALVGSGSGAVADLIVESLTHSPAAPVEFQEVTLSAVVRNVGTGPAAPSTLFLGTSAEALPVPAQLIAVPGLEPGSSFLAQRTVTHPQGSYTTNASVDHGTAVAETNETNNHAAEDFTVAPPAPPLSMPFADNFDDGGLNLAQYSVDTTPGFAVVENAGILRAGTDFSATGGFAYAHLGGRVPASLSFPVSIRARVRLANGQNGTMARIHLVGTSGDLLFGTVSNGGGSASVAYQRRQAPDALQHQNIQSGDFAFHEYRIDYDGATATLFFDTAHVATVPVVLGDFHVALSLDSPAAAGVDGESGEFDDFNIRGLEPMPPDLVSWWQGDGNGRDAHATNHGSANNVAYVTGHEGQALLLDGASAHVGVPYSATLEPPDITVDAWVLLAAYPPAAPANGWGVVSAQPYKLRVLTDGSVTFSVRTTGSGGVVSVNTGPWISPGGYHHIAGTYRSGDGGEICVYVDVRKTCAPSEDPIQISGGVGLLIGVDSDDSQYFNGRIDEVHLFARALAPSEIRMLAKAPIAIDDSATTPVDTPVGISVLANDIRNDNPTSGAMSIVAVSDPAHGDVVYNSSGTVTYTPDPGFKGVDTFMYTARNANDNFRTDTATVKIAVTNPPGIVFSEFRFSGPVNKDDEFVELYNNSDSDIVVSTTDGSTGWSVVLHGGYQLLTNHSPQRVFLPNGTFIPARGHYIGTMFYNSAGLAPLDYSQTHWGYFDGQDIPVDAGMTLFRTANPENFTAAFRQDSVGFSTVANPLFREGAGLPPLGGEALEEYSFVRRMVGFNAQDTDDNAADFVLVSPLAVPVGSNLVLTHFGAPAPENVATPIRGTLPHMPPQTPFTIEPFDSTAPIRAGANEVRTGGTLTIRRKITNTGTQPISVLSLRITDLATVDPATIGLAPEEALLLALGSTTEVLATPTGDVIVTGTSVASNNPAPLQPLGGGVNSAISLQATPLPPGGTVNIQIRFLVLKEGEYRFDFDNSVFTAP